MTLKKYSLIIILLFILGLCLLIKVDASINELPLLGRVIFVDPGHGGRDPGTSYGKIEEKDILENFDGAISALLTQRNGWYKWTGELDGIYSTWIILKTDSLYTATSMTDPRVVLRSNDLLSWYSSYAYWHA